MEFISYLINGISLGSVYAIIALGYTMVYGIAKMLNFAHGDVIMVGSYIVFIAVNQMGIPPVVAILLSMALCTVLGLAIERFAYKPLRGASSLAVLITAIGVSYLLQNLALLIWGSDPKHFTSVVDIPALDLHLAGGKIVVSSETVITIVTAAIIMVGLSLFVNHTKLGHAMLAVSEDKGAAQLMGVNVNRTITITFFLSGIYAALAGFLISGYYMVVYPTMGVTIGTKAFVAAVLGGIGVLHGSVVGGLLIGILECYAVALWGANVRDAVAFVILIVVLMFAPAGIFGKKEVTKI